MLLEILNETAIEYIDKSKNEKTISKIDIGLPFATYNILQQELKTLCKFNTEIPILASEFNSLVIHERTIYITARPEIDKIFEKHLLAKLALLENQGK